jgi:hypothetical protein
MSQQLRIKKRRKPSRPRLDFGAAAAPAFAVAGSGNAVATAPRLVLTEPEGLRDTLVTGSISAALHAAVLLGLVLAALLAPEELIEIIIPVEIIKDIEPVELPGSNAEPAPAGPKAVGAMRPSAAAMASASLTPAEAEALRQAALEAARKAVKNMEQEAARPTALPTQLERRDVQAESLAARAAAAESPATVIDVSDMQAIQIDPADLAALDIDLTGPQQIDVSNIPEMSAPEAFAVLSELGAPQYEGSSVSASSVSSASTAGRSYGSGGSGVDTGVASEWSGAGGSGSGVGGGGTGGTGTATGVVRCLESAYVDRYLEVVKDRTDRHWRVPEGVIPGTRVVLRFDLDAAGMATQVEVLETQDDLLGRSAMQALLSAAPFPPMDANNRCLADKRIKQTFTVPAS